jgi:hypothetical protein
LKLYAQAIHCVQAVKWPENDQGCYGGFPPWQPSIMSFYVRLTQKTLSKVALPLLEAVLGQYSLRMVRNQTRGGFCLWMLLMPFPLRTDEWMTRLGLRLLIYPLQFKLPMKSPILLIIHQAYRATPLEITFRECSGTRILIPIKTPLGTCCPQANLTQHH